MPEVEEGGTSCWSRAFTAEFIDLYRSVESVWNVKSKEYTDRGKKARGYDLLVSKVRSVDPSATRDTVVKKINCLRSSFRKEVKKVKADESYVPRLWYYGRLAFLEGHDDGTVAGEAVPPRDSNSSPSTDDDEPEDGEHKEIVNAADVECETIIDVKRPPPSLPASDECRARTPDPVRRPKKRYKCSPQQQQQVLPQDDDSYLQLIAEDKFDMVGKVVAAKLRSLPNEQRIYAEKLINDVLFEAELNTLGRGCRVIVPSAAVPNGDTKVCD